MIFTQLPRLTKCQFVRIVVVRIVDTVRYTFIIVHYLACGNLTVPYVDELRTNHFCLYYYYSGHIALIDYKSNHKFLYLLKDDYGFNYSVDCSVYPCIGKHAQKFIYIFFV